MNLTARILIRDRDNGYDVNDGRGLDTRIPESRTQLHFEKDKRVGNGIAQKKHLANLDVFGKSSL